MPASALQKCPLQFLPQRAVFIFINSAAFPHPAPPAPAAWRRPRRGRQWGPSSGSCRTRRRMRRDLAIELCHPGKSAAGQVKRLGGSSGRWSAGKSRSGSPWGRHRQRPCCTCCCAHRLRTDAPACGPRRGKIAALVGLLHADVPGQNLAVLTVLAGQIHTGQQPGVVNTEARDTFHRGPPHFAIACTTPRAQSIEIVMPSFSVRVALVAPTITALSSVRPTMAEWLFVPTSSVMIPAASRMKGSVSLVVKGTTKIWPGLNFLAASVALRQTQTHPWRCGYRCRHRPAGNRRPCGP